MDQISDIESIIRSQTWKKKPSSYQNSPLQRSPCRSPNRTTNKNFSHKSSQNTSQGSLEETATILIEPDDILIQDEKARIQELSKLAVPYKELANALKKINKKAKLPALIPAFPMRSFGQIKDSKLNPKFEQLKHDTYFSSLRPQEVEKIKFKNGRTTSNNTSRLPPLYSPRGSFA